MKIKITVKPNSSKNEIIEVSDCEYRANIKAPPQEGKANKELIKVLKKYFKKDVRIITGFKSREKIVEIY